MPKMDDIWTASQRLIGNMVFGPRPALAISGSGAATVSTGAAIQFALGGILRQRAALSAVALAPLASADFALPNSQLALSFRQPSGSTGFLTQPANTTAYYVLCVNAAGTVRVVQGTWDGQLITLNGLSQAGRSWVPDVPDTWVPFGMIKVVTGATTFLAGTDALDKANVTFTFMDLAVLPPDNP